MGLFRKNHCTGAPASYLNLAGADTWRSAADRTLTAATYSWGYRDSCCDGPPLL